MSRYHSLTNRLLRDCLVALMLLSGHGGMRTPAFADAQMSAAVPSFGAPSSVRAPSAPPNRYQTMLNYLPYQAAPGNAPLISVFADFGDGHPTPVLLDTGSSASFISDALAHRLGLTPHPRHVDGHPYLLGGRPVQVVSVPHTHLGGFDIRGEIIVLPEAQVRAVMPGAIEGLVGMNGLGRFAWLLEPNRHLLTLYSASPSETERRAQGFVPGDAVPLIPAPYPDLSGCFAVTATLTQGETQGTEILLVDTGAGLTQISGGLAARLGLRPLGQITWSEVTEQFTVALAMLDRIKFGPLSIKGKGVAYPTGGATAKPLLGMDVLSRSRVLLDFPSHKMYVAPDVAPGDGTTAAPNLTPTSKPAPPTAKPASVP